MNTLPITAVDLFCGVGGLTNGLEKSGIDVRLGIDTDPACEYPYTANNKARLLLKSVEDLEPQDFEQVFEKSEIRLMAGCAPCQTFSTYNRKATSTDRRWRLLLQFSRLVKDILPELVTMENVPRLIEQDVFKEFCEVLSGAGYQVSYKVVNCEDYGVPQQRKRLVLLASRLGPIQLLSPLEFGAEHSTVRECIANLPALEAGSIHESDPLHQSASLSPLNMERIQASQPDGSWHDWDECLVADCHKKSTGKTYRSVYGRMSWDKPAPTITTQFFGFGNGRFGHPEQDRAISLREGALLQSFPMSYTFTSPGKPIHKKTLGRLIGNAVPVRLAEVIGLSLLMHTKKENNNE